MESNFERAFSRALRQTEHAEVTGQPRRVLPKTLTLHLHFYCTLTDTHYDYYHKLIRDDDRCEDLLQGMSSWNSEEVYYPPCPYPFVWFVRCFAGLASLHIFRGAVEAQLTVEHCEPLWFARVEYVDDPPHHRRSDSLQRDCLHGSGVHSDLCSTRKVYVFVGSDGRRQNGNASHADDALAFQVYDRRSGVRLLLPDAKKANYLRGLAFWKDCLDNGSCFSTTTHLS